MHRGRCLPAQRGCRRRPTPRRGGAGGTRPRTPGGRGDRHKSSGRRRGRRRRSPSSPPGELRHRHDLDCGHAEFDQVVERRGGRRKGAFGGERPDVQFVENPFVRPCRAETPVAPGEGHGGGRGLSGRTWRAFVAHLTPECLNRTRKRKSATLLFRSKPGISGPFHRPRRSIFTPAG